MNPLPDRYRSDIDGLRALAVLPVILYHAGLSCPGGFVGVDVFFVISGYLITRVVERDLEQRRFSLLNFYQRRIRRIFPALFAMFFVSACVALRFLLPSELVGFGKSLLAASAFCSNFFFYRHSGYFASEAQFQPLLHTWTLSLEEQFYIFWPLTLAALGSRWLSRWKLPFLSAILLGSLLLSAHWVDQSPNAAFYLLPSRAWELALGAILSIAPLPAWLPRLPRRAADAASLLGLAMLIASITAYSSTIPFPGFAALLPCTGAALILATGGSGTPVGRILSFPPLVWTGLISYSLYLWHWPILVLFRIIANRELYTAERLGLVVLTFAVSWLSWRFIESPFRNPKIIGGASRAWVTGGLATSALFLLLGAVLFRSAGFPQRAPAVARWIATQQKDAEAFDQSPCVITTQSPLPAQDCLLGATTPAFHPGVVLWGDSHAAQFAQVFNQIGRDLDITIRQITKAGCPPTLGVRFLNSDRAGCPTFNDHALQAILADKQVRVVILGARWDRGVEGNLAVPLDHPLLAANDPQQLFTAGLRRTIDALVADGRHVILIGQVPLPDANPITCIGRSRFYHQDEAPCLTMPVARPAHTEALVNQLFSSVANPSPAVQIVRPFDLLCGPQTCRLVSAGRPLYLDQSHLSLLGTSLLEPRLEQSLASSLGMAGTSANRPKLASRQSQLPQPPNP